jgi:hypothetical protein
VKRFFTDLQLTHAQSPHAWGHLVARVSSNHFLTSPSSSSDRL